MTTTLGDKAAQFHALHRDRVLVLPNAWDVASACLVAGAGATAVATTSAGVAWSLGAPDGNRLDRDPAVELVARVAAAVGVPVTADIETGFADEPSGVAETVRRVIDAGAVGINLEDGARSGPLPLMPIEEYTARLSAARAAADATGVALFINARVDVFLRQVGERDSRVPAALERAAAYVEAGADGIFLPGVVDPETVATLAKEVSVPLNVLAGPGAPSVSTLADLGVARVSVGSSLAQAAYAVVRRGAQEVLSSGTYESLAGGLDYGELNAAVAGRP
ncbi:MAG TPA: isocitrate lyase/phosphoenolpyruvate mutase family protein [Actinophytocola sp.]|uniref:isocitrate lyase/PEP mutase family protein n=1 Tax=Actinophytocola sp. TaxID=1872138 RepID=UPI002DC0083B|nr:isocitrate lyase/phosphoenolpyruvate mutase family protein [Actinophytocola sp.]HEU5472336.1 isocitrate lyase/phosphoenolpyruvate mutase family protein [Actinophytocola sp.]